MAMHETSNTNVPKRSFFNVVVGTGLLAGLLDGMGAIINYLIKGGEHPEKIFNFIASGVFGKDGLTGGDKMVLLGVIFHLSIAFIWTMLFFLIYPKIKLLSKNRIATGFFYGLIIWVIMTRVVLPLSNAPKIPFDWAQAIIGMLILVVAIGLPISFIADRYYSRKS